MTTERAGDLPCKDLVEIITDYLEGVLPPAERERFETHLSACSGCRTYLEQMRATVAAAGRVTPDELPPESRRRLEELFRGWARPEGPSAAP